MDFYQEFENKARIKKYEKIISVINDYYDEYAQICNAKYSTSKIANRCIEEGTDVLRYYLTDFYDTKMNEEDERFLSVIDDINNIDKNTKFLKSVNTVFDYILSKLGNDTTFISKCGLEDKANYLLTNIDEIIDDFGVKTDYNTGDIVYVMEDYILTESYNNNKPLEWLDESIKDIEKVIENISDNYLA